jgi:exopolysaccharide biosynthesis polyprenyl glycosylphosphotransferase
MNRFVRNDAKFMPLLPQCAVLALTLLVSFSLLRAQIASPSGPMTLVTEAWLLLLLPIVLSAAVIARRSPPTRTLIVGASPLAHKLLEEIAMRRDGPDRVIGVADDASDSLEFSFRELLAGPLARLGVIIEELRPDRIIVALADRRGRLPMRELLEARVQGVTIEDAVDVYERLTGKLAIESLTPSHLISSRDFRKSHLDVAFGHAASIVASAVGLVVLAPLFGLIALAVKLDSPGPIFFIHDRVGLRGRRFKLIKFRTMRPAERTTSEWACDNTDRITRVGRWLRKFRLDELPQLINVIRGEMNLVGPRPHPVSNFELFLENIPYYSLRAAVRPGLTGWAQVRQGYANSLKEETEKMRYDLYYIKHMSVWLDLRILLRTVRIVFGGLESNAGAATALIRPVFGGEASPIAGQLTENASATMTLSLAASLERRAYPRQPSSARSG